MELTPDNIAKLSNCELRKALIKVGIHPAPLTPTTRKIYQRKLAKNLLKSFSSDQAEQQETKETRENKSSVTEVGDASSVTEVGSLPESTSSSQPIGDHGNSRADEVRYVITYPSGGEPRLFTDKVDAWNELKRSKGARIHLFESSTEADNFIHTCDKATFNCVEFTPASEQGTDHVTPKQVELNQLARAIEHNDDVTFDRLVLGNPRYLISSADGPVPLKPSTRYNALHVAAKSDQPGMVRKIIGLIEDPNFHKAMYGGASSQHRIDHLVDLYLNTPEKGNFETPLHLACKHGFLGVVSELLACTAIDRNIKNKYDETAFDVAGARCKEATARPQMLDLLGDQYFVPMMRCHDNSRPPIVLPPWTPRDPHVENGPSREPEEGVMIVSAIAGPMGCQEAAKMHKQWATPDRKRIHIRRSDADRGGERIGREIVRTREIPWLEYWDFLGNYADFSKDDGLKMLEDYLEERSARTMRRSLAGGIPSSSGDDSNSMVQYMGDSSPVLKKVPSQGVTSLVLKERQLEIVRNRLLKERRKRLRRVETVASPGSPHDPSQDNDLTQDLSERFSRILNLDPSMDSPPNRSVSLSNPQLPTSSGEGACLSEMKSDGLPSLGIPLSPVFIVGHHPSKVDLEVFEAMAGVRVDDVIYPNVARWRKFVLSKDEEEKKRWETPKKFNMKKFRFPDYSPCAWSSPLKPAVPGT